MIRYDQIEIKATVTPEGWIRDKPVITRAGIFTYKTKDGKLVKELRSDEDVFEAKSLESLTGIPITAGHAGLVNKDNSKGNIGTVISPGARSEDNVIAEIIIHDTNRLDGKRELSLGYSCDIVDSSGEYKGQRYDQKQTNIRYNHLAVVNRGRAGNAKLRLDSSDGVSFPFEMESTMTDPVAPKLATLRVDEIDYPAAPEVVNAYKKAKTEFADLKKRFDALEAERDGLKTKLTDKDKEIEKVKNETRESVKQRVELEGVAKQFELKLDEKDTDIDIKKKIITKLRPTIKLDEKSNDYIEATFDIVMEEDKDKNKKASIQKQRADGQRDNNNNNNNQQTGAEAARAKMIERYRNQGKPPQQEGKAA